MRLIDADVLKEDLSKFYDGWMTARELIDSQPTVELPKEKDNPWRFFNFRQATEEEKEYYKVEYGDDEVDDLKMIENVPGDGEEVLLWTGRHFTVDTYDDGMFDGIGEIEKGMAWRYLPEQPKECDCEKDGDGE